MEKILSSPLFYCFFSAIMFAVWPIIGRVSGLNASWMAFLVSFVSALIGMGALSIGNSVAQPITITSILLGVLAGLINGIGVLAYNKLISWQEENISILIPITTIIMMVSIVLIAAIVFHESITLKKVLGIFLGAIAIYLLQLQ